MSVSPLVAATSPEHAVWLSFAFYLLNLLAPIIPAVIIYRLFPEGRIKGESHSSVRGKLGGWTIKAAGAWGAYITAFILGYWVIKSTAIPLIKAVGGASVWTVESDVKLLDEHGQEINAAINNLIVNPPVVETWGKRATITLFSPTLDPPERLQVKLDGYDDATVPLKDGSAKDGKIALPSITLKRLPPLDASKAPPAPLAEGSGPPSLTTN